MLPRAITEAQTSDAIRLLRPDVVLVDFAAIGNHIGTLMQCESASQQPRFLMVSMRCTEQNVLDALKAGGCGCIGLDHASELARAVRAVHRGECWATRKTLAQALIETRKPRKTASIKRPWSALLSPRECEIVEWLRRGMSNKEIARALNISDATVKTHLHNIFQKLDIRGRGRLLGTLAGGTIRASAPAPVAGSPYSH